MFRLYYMKESMCLLLVSGEPTRELQLKHHYFLIAIR